VASTFGQLFRIATWGESHGPAVGVVWTAARAGAHHRGGESRWNSTGAGRPEPHHHRRDEADAVEILSGVHGGLTLGSPIALLVRNTDARSADYQEIRSVFRPSHADYTYQAKYGVRAPRRRPGQRARNHRSGRQRAIARKLLAEQAQIEIVAYVKQVTPWRPRWRAARSRERRGCEHRALPDAAVADQMIALIDQARADGDFWRRDRGSGAPRARRLGEPVFDKLHATWQGPAVDPGLQGLRGGQRVLRTACTAPSTRHLLCRERAHRTRTNRSGGIQGGISNGEDIIVRAAFKPVATILREMETVDADGNPRPCSRAAVTTLRAPARGAIVEAMMALVLADHFLRQRALL